MQIAKEFESEINQGAPHAVVQLSLGAPTCHVLLLPAERPGFQCPHLPVTSSVVVRAGQGQPPQGPGQFGLEAGATYVQTLPLKITKHRVSVSSVDLHVR